VRVTLFHSFLRYLHVRRAFHELSYPRIEEDGPRRRNLRVLMNLISPCTDVFRWRRGNGSINEKRKGRRKLTVQEKGAA